ncbi:hypothetical protein V8C26DRAFT_430682 [Trichoderma gracile]
MAIIDMDFGPAPTSFMQAEEVPQPLRPEAMGVFASRGLSSFEDPAAEVASRQNPKVPTSAAAEAAADTEPTWPDSSRIYQNLRIGTACREHAKVELVVFDRHYDFFRSKA